MALLLTRSVSRSDSYGHTATLRVGEDVTITVVGVRGNKVRLAVQAPTMTAIWREEIYQKLRAETPAGTPVASHANR